MALTKKAILAADDLPREEVDVPEWGGTVFVRMMTAAELDVYRDRVVNATGGGDAVTFRAGLVAKCLVGEDGERLFTDDEVADLGSKATSVMERLTAVALRLNGMAAEDVEEMAKN